MFNINKTLTVVKRELRDKLLSKTFVIMTLLLPIFMFGILGFQTFLLTQESDEGTSIELIAEDGKVLDNIQKVFQERTFIQNGYYKVNYFQKDSSSLQSYLEEKKRRSFK